MIFRIRFIEAGQNRQLTDTVEANSPGEAIVIFQMTRSRNSSHPSPDIITSVSLEESLVL